MGALLKWTAKVAVGLLVCGLVLWMVSRLRGATAEQEAALAMMEKPWRPQGRNAFAAVWLLRYDVPEARQEAIATEDAKRLQALPRPGIDTDGSEAIVDFESIAKGRYRDLSPSAEDQAMLCKASESGCLAKVRSDQDAYRALVERNAELFARAATLSRYDYYRNEFPWRFDAPFPQFQLGASAMTQHALQFVRGDVDTALAATCRDMSTWRRLGANSDSLITRMIGIAYSTDGYGRLLADMLAQLPREHALPADCSRALAPMTPAELSLCRPMRGEFQFSNNAMATIIESKHRNWLDKLSTPLVYDAGMTRADMATTFASACSSAALERAAADQMLALPLAKPSLWRLECVSNAAGCILADIARPAYTDYALRAQDQGAHMRLLATLAWLRQQPSDDRPLAALLAARPQALKSPSRDIEVTADGKAIRIRQFETRRAEYWQLPLPEYLWQRSSGR